MTKSIKKDHLQTVLKQFSPISLDQLNSTMSLMERIDKKYILTMPQLDEMMDKLKDDYYVLTIKDISLFNYDNVYMDTEDYLLYYQHEYKDATRMKVRTRHYVDSSLGFLEVKHKEGDVTRKFRYQIPVHETQTITPDAQEYYARIGESFNSGFIRKELSPAIATRYQRITLCSKKNDERITIDLDISVRDMRDEKAKRHHLPSFAIVESKSNNTSCASHTTIKAMGVVEAKGCSKYCLGVYYVGKAKTHDSFIETIKVIESFRPRKLTKVVKKVKATLRQLKKQTSTITKELAIKTPTKKVVAKKAIVKKVTVKKTGAKKKAKV